MSGAEFTAKTIRYLGNKRKLASFIENEFSRILPAGGTIVDLFSGSSAIGYYLVPKYKIISNDIEPYAYCIAKALIEDSQIELSKANVSKELHEQYQRNLNRLSRAFRDLIDTEAKFIQDHPHAQIYKRFCFNTPYIGNWHNNSLNPNLKPIFESATHGVIQFPYVLFSTYFMNSYFGSFQSMQIDSIRYAIDKITGPAINPRNPTIFYKLIAALIYTVSYCVSSPGHFAQASSPNNRIMTKRLLKERVKDIWEIFLDYIDLLFSQPRANDLRNHAFQMDAFKLIEHLRTNPEIGTCAAVYVDPPYTADHYSRYYHVLNTLLLYDYPACIGKGRYRDDRYVSPFSLKSKASITLRNLLTRLEVLRLPVIVSYTSVGIIPLQDVGAMCRSIFENVRRVTIPYNHSSQGRKPSTSKDEVGSRTEVLFICQPK